jgi:hypothetical protein
MNNKETNLLNALEDIQKFKFEGHVTIDGIKVIFRNICKKHNIVWGKRNKHGSYIGASPEWMACYELYKSMVIGSFELDIMLDDFDEEDDEEEPITRNRPDEYSFYFVIHFEGGDTIEENVDSEDCDDESYYCAYQEISHQYQDAEDIEYVGYEKNYND